MYKAIDGLTSPYLTDYRNTQLANSYNVHVPSHNIEILKLSFVYNGSARWNSLRHDVKW